MSDASARSREQSTGPLIGPAFTLARRDITRFYRQRSRIAGLLGSPLIFWFVLGSGFAGSFSLPSGGAGAGGAGASYLEYYFPGTVVLTILFSAIFSTITVIEDRDSGFLQGVLVSPAARPAIALGKIFGGLGIALVQSILLLAIFPVVGTWGSPAALGLSFLSLATLATGLTGLGFAIAWRMDSAQGFHTIMNLLLIPLWLLSGSIFPITGAAGWVSLLMQCNPLYYGVAAFRQSLYLDQPGAVVELHSLPFNLLLISLFSLILTVVSSRVVRSTT